MTRFAASLLAALLATAGLPPCFAMDMDMATTPSSHCEGMPVPAADPAPDPAPAPVPTSAEDCCEIGEAPDQRAPLDRPALVGGESPLVPLGAALSHAEPPTFISPFVDVGSPPTPVRRHLLLTVLLI
jgi:hypothetical protein